MMEGGTAEFTHQLEVHHELERAVVELSSRGLHTAARWAAEQLNGLDASVLQAAAQSLGTGRVPPMELDTQDRHPLFMLARQHFEFKVW
jgi:prophage DNA circulation protein